MANLDPFGIYGGTVTQGKSGGNASANAGKVYDPFNIASLPAVQNTASKQQPQAKQPVQQPAQQKSTSLFGKLGHAVAATGRFVAGDATKLANTAIAEGKQVGYTAEELAANATHNPQAFTNANIASQNAYKTDNQDHKGILGVGTVFKNGQEAASGNLKTGVERIGGGTLGAAADIAPLVLPIGKTAKGASLLTKIGRGAAENAALSGVSTVANETMNGQFNAGQIAKSTATGALIGGLFPAIHGGAKYGKEMVFDKPSVKPSTPDLLALNQIDQLIDKNPDGTFKSDVTKIPVKDQSTGAIQGKVTSNLPEVQTPTVPAKPSVQGYSDTDFRLQFNKGAKELTDSQPNKWNYLNPNFEKATDPLTRVIGVLSHASGKGTISDAVEHLLPELGGAEKNSLVRDISNSTTHQETADLLWDAAKNHETSVNAEGTPVTKQVSFEEPTVSPTPTVLRPAESVPTTQESRPISQGEPQGIQTPASVAGETVKSKLGSGVDKKAVEAKLTTSLGELPEYNRVNMKDQASYATDLLAKDEQHAIDIATGKTTPPAHILPESVFTAVENKALKDGNVDLLRQLATSTRVGEATAMGQRIRALAERNPDSAVGKMKELSDARVAAVEKKTGKPISKSINETVKQIQQSKMKVTRQDWASFVEGIKCK